MKEAKKNKFQFSIRTKILLGFFIIIFIYLFIMLNGHYYMSKTKIFVEEVVPKSKHIGSFQELAVSLESLEGNIDNFFAVGYEEYQEGANEDLENMFKNLNLIEKGLSENGFYELEIALRDLKNSLSELKTNVVSLKTKEEKSSSETNEKIILIYSLINDCREKNRYLLTQITNQLHKDALEQKTTITKVVTQNLLMGFFALVIAVITALIISKSISRPIKTLRDASIKIGKGELTTRIKVKSKDEIGELTSAFNQMAFDLKKYRTHLKGYTEDLEKEVGKRTKQLDIKLEESNQSKIAIMNMMEDLTESFEKLKELDKMKDEFLEMTAHELKTPLTVIIGYVQLMIDGRIGNLIKRQKEVLNIISQGTQRLKNSIDKMLEITKLESGEVKYNLEEVQTIDIIQEVINSSKDHAKEKNISIITKFEKLPKIYIDEKLFMKVIANLFDNAIKFTDKGSITIKTKKQRGNIIISIKDTGRGIIEDNMDQLFTKFFQADHTISGVGLGLTISQKIVRSWGGKLWAKSQGLGKGTTFFLTLPIKRKVKVGFLKKK